MKFSIPYESKNWFSEARTKDILDIEFDILYLCLVVGLAKRKRRTLDDIDLHEITDKFPARYQPQEKIIISLFLATELSARGITMTEKRMVHDEIAKLVSTVPPYLSPEGMRRFHEYVVAGFETIIEEFDAKPTTPETLLRKYLDILDKALVHVSV